MAFALLFKKDGSGRIVVPMSNENTEELEEQYKGHFEGRFETKEHAEIEKEKLEEREDEGSGWQ